MKALRHVGRLLLFAYVVGSAALGILLANVTLHPIRARVHAAGPVQHWADSMHARFEDVAISAADGTELRAWLVQPERSRGSIVLMHGVSDNREGVFGFAQLFAGHGYTVLLPDSRAHGESGGAMATYGVKERDDVARWVEWLRHRDGTSCLFGFGESMGGAILLQSVGSGGRFCAVIAESPFATFRQGAYDRLADSLRMPLWVARTFLGPAVEIGMIYARLRYGVWLGDANPADVVATTATPVFLIHGLADTNLRPQQSLAIQKANPKVIYWGVEGAAHCGAFAAAGKEFERRVLDWFDSHAAPAGGVAR